jgi:protein SCO1/2
MLRVADHARTFLALALTFLAPAVPAHQITPPSADFVAPAAGSYRLERIYRAPSGRVVDVHGSSAPITRYTEGRATLLSLMYTQCNDEKGCPLALHTLDVVRKQLARMPQAKNRVRLVSLSFDPARDTPAVLRDYAGDRVRTLPAVPWSFLVPAAGPSLGQLLEGFEQDVSRAGEDAGTANTDLSHVLKVFLIDRRGWVREIYSTSYLVPQVVINDVKTLLMEDGVRFP